MEAKTIAGVPRVTYFIGDKSYLTPFIGSLYAALKPLGGDECYSDVLAASGAGNRLRWMPGRWDASNVDILQVEEPPFAPHHRALKAVGWEGEVKLTKPIAGIDGPLVNAETARQDVVTSIDAGVPVIALGVIGPPECCVLFGYEGRGKSVVGWNYFQGDEGWDVEKPFSKEGWFDSMWGYILLKNRVPKPSLRESGLAALQAVAALARSNDVRGAKVGLAAWEAALHQLEHDSFEGLPVKFPPEGPNDDAWENTLQGRFLVYCDMLCQVHERGVALPYWRKLASEAPEWGAKLKAAIECWEDCAPYGGYLWKFLTMDEAGYAKFGSPEVRKALADEGRRCMAKDREAVEHIEALLASLDCSQERV